MVSFEGKGGIKVEVVADSISPAGQRITTFRFLYPRWIHAELMTHRVLSRNASSSRAVPTATAADMILENPALPIFWGKNQAGMQAKEELEGDDLQQVKEGWVALSRYVANKVKWLAEKGLHKQHAARPLEAFQFMNVIVTATDWNNFLHLRVCEMAQPEIEEVAKLIKQALIESHPVDLYAGEWHLPFVNTQRNQNGFLYYLDDNNNTLSLEDAKKVSASVCAQVSYRKGDSSVEKAKSIWERLVGAEKVHASPFEHQATPMYFNGYVNQAFDPQSWETGVTHVTRDGLLCSGNFKGWIQHRQLIPNHVVN